ASRDPARLSASSPGCELVGVATDQIQALLIPEAPCHIIKEPPRAISTAFGEQFALRCQERLKLAMRLTNRLPFPDVIPQSLQKGDEFAIRPVPLSATPP